MSDRQSPDNEDRRRFLLTSGGLLTAAALRTLGIIAPAGATVLSGCIKNRDPEEMLRRIVIAVDERVQTLDPAQQYLALDSFVIVNIFDTLVFNDIQINLIPRLATAWNSPDDGKTWTFNIRPNVLFHDGTTCDAAAVKAHFERIRNPDIQSKRAKKMNPVDEIEVVDPLTVRFHLNKEMSVFPVTIRDSYAGIVSPTAAQKYGKDDFTNHPIGSGPYMFVEQDQGERILLKKNPNYWRADDFLIEEIEFRTIREPTTRLIMLEQGSIDMCSITYSHGEVVEKSDKAKLLKTPYLAVRYVGFNNMKPPFDDVRVRRAANMAINKDLLVKHAFRGNAIPLYGPLPTLMPAFNKKMPIYKYDLEEARRLMKEAGYEKGVDVVLWTKDDSSDTNLGVVVADQLSHIGIRVQIIRYDRNVYWDKFDPYQTDKAEWFPTKDGVFDLCAAGWVGGEHPHSYLDPLFRSTSNSNVTFYKNQKIDDLLDKSLRTVDDAQRQGVYDEIQETIVEDSPWIFAYSTMLMYGISPRLSNIQAHPAGEYYMEKIALGGGDGVL